MKRKKGSKKIALKRAHSPTHAPPLLAGDASDDDDMEAQGSANSKGNSDIDEFGGFESSNEENSNTKRTRLMNTGSSTLPDLIEPSTDKKPQLVTPMAKPHLVFNRMKVKLKTSTVPASSVKISPCEVTGKVSAAEEKQEDKIDGDITAKSSIVTPPTKDISSQEDEEPQRKANHDKHELISSLTVINKIMKMDAAEPFNVPVNPEALGIPDYFDVIDTPMDFGTIASNLERGTKYKNSEDVYKDVQFIWDNCAKYNSKGAYVLDLMRRVKKNFMKYWTSAGLYTEPNLGSEDGSKPKKAKKRTGRRHKSNCMCAICVLKRRRREREESEKIARGNVAIADLEEKQESSGNGDSSSNMDESELDVEEKEDEAEKSMQKEVEEEEDSDNEDLEDNDKKMIFDSAGKMGNLPKESEFEVMKVSQVEQREIETNDDLFANRKEALRREQKAKVYSHYGGENSKLVDICNTLFPLSSASVWRGPHSLFPSQISSPKYLFHEALNSIID